MSNTCVSCNRWRSKWSNFKDHTAEAGSRLFERGMQLEELWTLPPYHHVRNIIGQTWFTIHISIRWRIIFSASIFNERNWLERYDSSTITHHPINQYINQFEENKAQGWVKISNISNDICLSNFVATDIFALFLKQSFRQICYCGLPNSTFVRLVNYVHFHQIYALCLYPYIWGDLKDNCLRKWGISGRGKLQA